MAILTCKYLDGTSKICTDTEYIEDIKVNGVSIGKVSNYNVNSTDVVEVDLGDGTIKSKLFQNCTNLVSVTIPEGVTQILPTAFRGCTGLKTVDIPDTVEGIREYAFYGCSSLESINIGCNATSIGYYAFRECTSLKSITITSPIAPQLHSYGVFVDVPSNGTLYYPEGADYSTWLSAAELGYYNWNGEEVYFPLRYDRVLTCKYSDGTTSICNDTTGISKILVNGTDIGRINEYNVNSNDIVEFELKGSVISKNLFRGCLGLTEVTIPVGVTSIGEGAFNNCESLSKITTNAIVPPSFLVSGDNFYEVARNGVLYFPEGSDYSEWLYPDVNDLQQHSECHLGQYGWRGEVIGYNYETPIDPNRVVKCRYKDGTKQICYSINGFTDIFVNGVSIKLRTIYEVNSNDIVEFVLKEDKIGDLSFYGCTELRVITIPDGITSIGVYAFRECSNLKKITLPNTLISIGTGGFAYCSSLVALTLPDSLTTLNNSAFNSCSGLKAVTLPDSLTYIGDAAFWNCLELRKIEIPDNVTYIGSQAFYTCQYIQELTIPNGVTTLHTGTFMYCYGLKKITLPETLTTIDYYVFYKCDSLKEIIVKAPVAPSIHSNAFGYDTNTIAYNGTLYYPEGADYSSWLSSSPVNLGYCKWNGMQVDFDGPVPPFIPDDTVTTNIKCRYADRTTKICYNTTGISDILVNGVSIGRVTKYDVNSNDIVEFVLDYGYYRTFNGCDTLLEVILPDSMTEIPYYMFWSCDSLRKIRIPEGITSIGDYAFSGCYSLKEITIPYGVTYIGENAFSYCYNLQTPTLPDTLTYIGRTAFANCLSFKEITLPNSLTYIGSYAVGGCINLERITLPEYIESLDGSVIQECGSIKEITMPLGITTLPHRSFYKCYSLEKVTLPSTINTIGSEAFTECFSLKEITIPSPNVPEITEDMFYEVDSYGTLYYLGLADYSQWLSEDPTYLGYYKWDGVKVGPFFEVSTTTINAPANGTTEIVSVVKDEINSVSITCPDWIEVSEIIDGYQVVVKKNKSLKPRTGTITFTAENDIMPIVVEITVNQEKGEMYLDITPTSISVSTNGGTKDITIDTNAESVTATSDTWFNVSKLDDTTYRVTIPENTHYIRKEGKITITASANGETDITRNIPVYQDELYLEPKITVISEETSFTLPADGGSITIDVEYYGANKIFDVEAQDWVTITGKEINQYYDDKGAKVSQWRYTAKVVFSDKVRTTNFTFSCTDANGNVFSISDVTLTQKIPSNPSVYVSKNNITLDNVGDTSIIQVTYIDIDEIIPPEAPDGFEIVEIERVITNEGIQIKYQVKRVSPKRLNAQINFNATSDGGKVTSPKVTLSGDPVPATVKVAMIWPSDAPTDPNSIFYIGRDGNDSDIKINVDNPNAPYQMTYQINGNNNAISCIDSEVSEGDNYVYYRYEFKTIENNTNNPFTGTIDFHYTDELTDKTVSVTYYVPYANEGRIDAGSTKYEYDKDGNNLISTNGNRFSISYFNMETINTPVCEVDWITLGDGVLDTGAYADERVKYNYSIDVSPNAGPERTGYVIFSGKGIDGKDYAFEIAVKQEGTNTEKPIDEGFIELLQLSVVLPGNGGSETFQVKYYDAKTIYNPELQYSWATIREVSRTEPTPDVAWNGEECDSIIVTYEVTAQATDSGREMKVKFSSDINYYDGGTVYMEKDKFVIYQLAEGSTELQGSVKLIRGNGEYTHYGSAIGWDPEVGYKDVTPVTPTISQSWCRIKNVKDKTSKDYDYYKTYELEVDANYSEVSRTCQITFIGNCEDGTQIKVPFTITQKGYDGIVNEGEYDNYKGYFRDYEGALHSISFITNPRSDIYGDITLAGESPVVVSYSTSETLYEPLRTSICTVRVVSSNYLMNLYSGKAQGTQVVLRNEDRGSVEWCGYLQPNLYNQGYSSEIEEIEFEASDCLSTLQYLKYEYYFNGNGMPMIVSFKNIIDTIMDKSRLINSYAFTQKTYSNSDETKMMDFKDFNISENNFYSEEGEPWTYMEVLEEVCKYFGYVCFQWGDRVYFIDYDNYTSTKSMTGYVYEKDDDWRSRTMKTLSNFNTITEDSYRGTGADMSLDDIYNKVTVNCNYYNVEDIIPDLFDDDKLTERNGITITTVVNRGQEIGSKTSYITYDHDNIISHFYKPLSNTNNHEIETTPTEAEFKSNKFFKSFVGANIVDMYHLDYGDVSGRSYESKEWERYLMISQLNRPWCGYEGTWHWEDYNFPIMEFTQLPQIFIDNNEEVYSSNTSTGGGRVPSRRAGGIGTSSSTSRNDRNTVTATKSEHYLVINAEAAFSPNFDVPFIDENADPRGFEKKSNNYYEGFYFDKIRTNDDAADKEERQKVTPALTFYLEIPQAGWWNGQEWVHYETWFEVPLEKLDYLKELWYTSKNVENKVNTNLFLGTAGYKIPLPKEMDSTAFMQFKIGMPKRFAHIADIEGGDYTGTAGNAYCFIKDLEMNIVSKNSALMKDEDIVFENIIDDYNVIDGPEIELKITSDNNITYSFSTVSTVYGEDYKPTTNFRFYDLNGELVLPEEAIIEKYVNQYSTPSIKETVTVDMSFTPAQLIIDSYWNKDFVIVGQEIDYQTCAQTLTLLEKK